MLKAETQNTMDEMLYAEEYIAHVLYTKLYRRRMCATLQLNVPEIFLVEKIY